MRFAFNSANSLSGYRCVTPLTGHLENYFGDLKKNNKLKAIVTAGPTNEYIDPVRFISNKSSGKQGYEIAKSLSKRGFDTTLISGPTHLEIDEDINFVFFSVDFLFKRLIYIKT